MAKEIGDNARQTILDRYSTSQFVDRWQEVLYSAANITFKG